MEPTLDLGQRVLVNRRDLPLPRSRRSATSSSFTRRWAPNREQCGGSRAVRGGPCPEPTPEESDTNFIKRIVAGPGDHLTIHDGHPVVNGVEAKEDFIKPCGSGNGCNLPKQITIPDDHVLHDGRQPGASDDSRFWGPVPRDWIIGEAFFTYWPPDRIGLL